jgi:hypothetical protein
MDEENVDFGLDDLALYYMYAKRYHERAMRKRHERWVPMKS